MILHTDTLILHLIFYFVFKQLVHSSVACQLTYRHVVQTSMSRLTTIKSIYYNGICMLATIIYHRRRKQGGEGAVAPLDFFGLTESIESRSRVK